MARYGTEGWEGEGAKVIMNYILFRWNKKSIKTSTWRVQAESFSLSLVALDFHDLIGRAFLRLYTLLIMSIST